MSRHIEVSHRRPVHRRLVEQMAAVDKQARDKWRRRHGKANTRRTEMLRKRRM